MYRALVVGCGNIGGLYDLEVDGILSHAKAFHFDPRFSLSVYDIDKDLSKSISNKYNCEQVQDITTGILQTFDCVSICTPTKSHFTYLEAALQAKVKLIICEKPVSNVAGELNGMKELYKKGQSRIVVNYIRRFQPSYKTLKNTVRKILENESLTNISIRYQRGFCNNCGHAFDTIEYLTGTKLALSEIRVHNKSTDHFHDDPTLSLQGLWNKTNVSVTGLSDVRFSLFEIDLYFQTCMIRITNAGSNIDLYRADINGTTLQRLQIQQEKSQDNCLKDYMKHVINHAHDLLEDKNLSDNFPSSVDLNLRMLDYINR